jgi:hypothetical protein
MHCARGISEVLGAGRAETSRRSAISSRRQTANDVIVSIPRHLP